jgi:hypothetical protein
MDELMLFTDGSVNTHSNIGYGAYLAVRDGELSLDALRGDCVYGFSKHHELNQKDDIAKLFTLVDRASRNAMRRDNRF